MKPIGVCLLVMHLVAASAQLASNDISSILQTSLIKPEVVRSELLSYLLARASILKAPSGADNWKAEASRLRQHVLKDVIFHGWPPEWVNAPPRFEPAGVIEAKGYRIRKFRYEIVPGFWSAALFYEPEQTLGKRPAVLNLLGHYKDGKAMAFEQMRCINYALQGQVALDLEWIGCGELHHAENNHWFASALDLAGANGAGLFYLAMRRGLDFLEQQPEVDKQRLGVTGLSGGGWQTIVLGALDERVAVAVPVAGTCSLISKLDRPEASNIGDIEEIPTDLLDGQDYPHLVALRAPRPTLLIYNASDDCCYRAPLTQPYMYDNVLPIFSLFDSAKNLQWHENIDPGTHNYGLDNRQQSYRFFGEQFRLPLVQKEIAVEDQVRTIEQLNVGLSEGNLTILSLAKKLALENQRATVPSSQGAQGRSAGPNRAQLKMILRYNELSMAHPWMLVSKRDHGVRTISYHFHFTDGLSATGVWLKPEHNPEDRPLDIILHDQGKRSAAAAVLDSLNRGNQVLALDLLFTGEATPETPWEYNALLASTGKRPLGIEAGQLICLAKWMRQMAASSSAVRLETFGMRSQVIALAAMGLEPNLFSPSPAVNGIESLRYLIERAIPYKSAPDLFCLDLEKSFDLDKLRALGN